MLTPIRRIFAPLFTSSPLSPPSQQRQRHMQEATDRLTQDTPHDIALGRCSFAGLQLTVTKQASRVSNDGMIGNCAGQRRKLWPKGRIATHTLPRRSVQMRRACRTMVDPGISAGGAVPSAHGMAWHATYAQACCGRSVCHGFTRGGHYTGMPVAASNSAGAAETCGHQQLEWWQGLL